MVRDSRDRKHCDARCNQGHFKCVYKSLSVCIKKSITALLRGNKYLSIPVAVSRLEVPVPVAVLHVVELVRGPRDGAGDAGVAPRAPGEELEVGPRHVLVTLQAVVQAPVRLVVVLAQDPADDAHLQQDTLVMSIAEGSLKNVFH